MPTHAHPLHCHVAAPSMQQEITSIGLDADGILCTTQAMGSGRGDGERGQGYRKLWQQVYIPCLPAAWHAQGNPDIHEHHCKPFAMFWPMSIKSFIRE